MQRDLNACQCMDEQCPAALFEVTEIGTERNAALCCHAELWRCRECDRAWLRYAVEDESSPAWNRWYRGLVPAPADSVAALSLDSVHGLLRRVTWHFYGGAYYRSSGDYSTGPVPVVTSEVAQAA